MAEVITQLFKPSRKKEEEGEEREEKDMLP